MKLHHYNTITIIIINSRSDHFAEHGRHAGCARGQLNTPSLPASSRRVVNKCGSVSQAAGRLQQEETGLNRCEQLPTAAAAPLRSALNAQ